MDKVKDTDTRIRDFVREKNKQLNLGLSDPDLYELADYYSALVSENIDTYEDDKLLDDKLFEEALKEFQESMDPQKMNEALDKLLAESGDTYTDYDLRLATKLEKERNRHGLPGEDDEQPDELDVIEEEYELYGDNYKRYGYDDLDDPFFEDVGPRMGR